MSWDFIKGNLHEAYWSNYYCWLIEEKASVLWYSRFIYRHLLYILVKNKAFIRAQVAHGADALLLLREKFTDFPVCVIRYIFIRKLSHLTISSPFILKNQKKNIQTKMAFRMDFYWLLAFTLHLVVGTFVIYYLLFMVFLETLVFMVDSSWVYTRKSNFFSCDGFRTNLA